MTWHEWNSTRRIDGGPRDRTFKKWWIALSHRGLCDAAGGAEYRRVYAEWLKAGRPKEIRAFIVDRANLGPGGPQEGA